MTNDYIVLCVFFKNTQNKLLQNFIRHRSETERPVITKVNFVTLLENCDIWQLPVNWDLSRIPRPLKNNWQRPQSDITQLFEYFGMNFIRHHIIMWIQLEQEIPHNSELAGSLLFPQSQPSSSGHLGSQDPSSVLKRDVKKALKVSVLSISQFVRWPSSSSNGPKLHLVLLLQF